MAKKVTDEEIAEALRRTYGLVTSAAILLSKKLKENGEKSGISHQAISKRIEKNKRLQNLYEELRAATLDMAEMELLKLIKDGNLGAICFFLKCKGKKRGWIEHQKYEADDIGRDPIIDLLSGVKDVENK